MKVRGKFLHVSYYGIWCAEPANFAGSANFYADILYIQNSGGGSTIYMSDAGTGNQNWRTWITAQEVKVDSGSFSAISYYARGRHYLYAEKVSAANTGNGIDVGNPAGGQVFLTIQKLSAASNGSGLKLSSGNALKVQAQIALIEEGAKCVEVEAGELYLTFQRMITTAGKGLVHSGGISRIMAGTIDTLGIATNRPVEISAAGCILDGVTLLANAAMESIQSGSAQTVKVYRQVLANRAKHMNITIDAALGTLLVSGNVT
jgi:hypothetical protein